MRAVLAGEGMLELSRDGPGWRLSHGGDTLNLAIHLARAGIQTAFLTALGTDRFSQGLRAQWADEGLDTSLILTDPARNPGLYAIAKDAAGERSFTYWRGDSAARGMFACSGIEQALERAAQADLFGFSLITLAILPPPARERLYALARQIRARGGKVAFDGNYRPRLWRNAREARAACAAAIACADIGLPTLEDEVALHGAGDAGQVARHWASLGCAETVVKLGALGCRLPDGAILPPPRMLEPVDTSGAGDAFDAGYLSARMNGAGIAESAAAGHALAGWTIMRPGASPPRDS